MPTESKAEYDTLAYELLLCPADKWLLLDWPPEYDAIARRGWRNRIRIAMCYRFGAGAMDTLSTPDGHMALRIRPGDELPEAQAALIAEMRKQAPPCPRGKRLYKAAVAEKCMPEKVESAKQAFFRELAAKVVALPRGQKISIIFPGALDTPRDRHHRAHNARMGLKAHGVCAGLTISGTSTGVEIRHRLRGVTLGRPALPPGEKERRAAKRAEDKQDPEAARIERRRKSFERSMRKREAGKL